MYFSFYSYTNPVLATEDSKCHEIYLSNYDNLNSDID